MPRATTANIALTVQCGTSFVNHLRYLCLLFVMLSSLFIAALKSPVGKGLEGCTLILSYIRRLRSSFCVQIVKFNIILGFQKNQYFWGMNILWIFFGGSSQNWAIFKGHIYAF